jgi:hypothetical protein
MEFQRRGSYDLIYMKTKELGWKETHGNQNIGIEDSQGNRRVEQSQMLIIWKNYITEIHDRSNRPETLEVEPEGETDADGRAHIFCKVKWKKTIKEMKNKKATGDDDVPGDVLKLLGKVGFKVMTILIKTIY